MDEKFQHIEDEVEVLAGGVDESSWKKCVIFLDDQDFRKQLRRKRTPQAQAS